MKRLALLLPLLALAAAPARADTIWPPPAHVDEARFTEPAVTIDGEIAATLGDVNRLVFDPNAFIPGGRSWAYRRPLPLSATNVIRRILLRGRNEDGMRLTNAGWTELMAALGPEFSSSGFGYVRFSWRFEDGSFFQIPASEGVWLGCARFGKDGVWTPAIPPSRTSISNAFEAIAVGAYAAARGEFDFDLLDPVPRAVLRVCEERLEHFPWHFLHAVRPFGADTPTNGVPGIVFLGPDDGRPFPDRMLAVFNWSSPATTRILRFAGDFSADEPPLRDPNALLYDFEASRVDLDETSDRPALRLRGFYRHKGLPAELVVEIDANGEFAVREARRAKGAEPEPHAESAENAEPNSHAVSAE